MYEDRDEGPSDEDLERFDHDEAYCPDCGAEIWDDAVVCPACQAPVVGGASRPPVEQWFRQRWFMFVAIVVLIAFITVALTCF